MQECQGIIGVSRKKINADKLITMLNMKREIQIQNAVGFCKKCFRFRRHGSAYCGHPICRVDGEPPRMKIYQDEQKNFPLFEKAKNKFKTNDKTIFTYGDTIFFDKDLPFHLVAHEITHIFQQQKTGAEKWWDKYFSSKKFRLKQETEAYRNQYECQKRNDIEKAVFLLERISDDLSGELYGNIVSKEKAIELITNSK